MYVDQTGNHQLAARVDDAGAGRCRVLREIIADPAHAAVGNQQVEERIHPVGRVYQPASPHQNGRHRHSAPAAVAAPSAAGSRVKVVWNSTAMRTATPLVTWSRMSERAPSATSAATSMPRFIGPG